MKVGVVYPYNINTEGVIHDQVVAIVENLKKRGHSATIIAPSPVEGSDVGRDGVRYVGSVAGLRTPFSGESKLAISATTQDIEALYYNETFDIMHFHDPWIPILSRQLLAQSSVVNIATFHRLIPEDVVSRSIARIWQSFIRSAQRNIDQVTIVSSELEEQVSQILDAPIAVIPHGFDVRRIKSAAVLPYGPFDNEVQTVLFNGQLDKDSQVLWLIKAFHRLQQDRQFDVRLVLAGDGPERRALQNYVERHHIPSISFLGKPSVEDAHRLISVANLVVVGDVSSVIVDKTILEAMLRRVPVIVPNNTTYSAFFSGVGAISVVDPRSTSECADIMCLLLYDRRVRNLLIDWAVTQAEQFDMERVVDAYETLFLDAIRSKDAKS